MARNFGQAPSQMARPASSRVKDRKTWHLYDSVAIVAATGTAELTFFTQPIGQGTSAWFGSGTKGIMDTNMRDTSLVKGEDMKVTHLGVYIGPQFAASGAPPTSLTIVNAFLVQQGILEITRSNDAIAFQAPVWACPAGGGANASPTTYLGNGSPFSEARTFLRRNPIIIRSQESFTVKVRYGSTVVPTTTNVVVQVLLYGEVAKDAL